MDGHLHALAANPRIEFGDETKALIEDALVRLERIAQEMRDASGTMETAAGEMNRAVTRQRTGG